ncbi:sigma-54-dependent transcriptional regulator [Psychroflexus planctonicus]|uniref:Sigma-54-dependent Fis family transcriptional regulator n=1 Tax=Psychroflexus planctonicus TaxID=1526575 RepID=A0ABQ1SEH1_9FLAO|nr:sigma-54 dependent transcriptional regulator [Psychroflexus planctonicus]GGE26337.1 sigma-54-dependent Fis family transcriptional regulator [Psychroflexus planctonicus]
MNKKNTHILIVDDEPELRNLLARILELEDYSTFTAKDGKQALKLLAQQSIHVVITDVQMPEMNGIKLIEKIKTQSPETEVICLTAYGKISDGVKAIKNGAYDYLEKDNYRTKIIPIIAKAAEKASLQFEVQKLRKKLNNQKGFEQIIGKSPAIQKAIDVAKKVAPTDAMVLLTGQTGTGKEIFANAIHHASPRASENMVVINCAALGKDILESELFGHKQGAFTGATKDKIGLFEEAHKGTIFLDEIGEMELDLQAKILRVLEDGSFIKLGDTKQHKVDVRILSATNRNLQKEVENGNFREDLFYRLSMFQIELPSLNERPEDIIHLAQYFLKASSLKTNKNIESLSETYQKALQDHNWRGNIRELKNLIERSVILEDTDTLTLETLPFNFQNEANEDSGLPLSLKDIEKKHIQKILTHTNQNKTQSAKILDIGLTTLYAKIKEYGLN